MDRGAWRAMVPGLAESRMRLKRLSTHILDVGILVLESELRHGLYAT